MTDSNRRGPAITFSRASAHEIRELRPVSILYCDMVDSTGLSRRLHPEDYQDLLVRFRDICARSAEQLTGKIVQSVADNVVAYFGYPVAAEDDSIHPRK